MSICGVILLSVIEVGSLEFSHDPVVEWVSLKLGAEKGFRSHLILSFESEEHLLDSAKYILHRDSLVYWETVYKESFWKPYYRINFGIRVEYYLTRKEWYQPYIGVGIEGERESGWTKEYKYPEGTIRIVTPKLSKLFSLGPATVMGIDFYPFPLISQLFRFKIPFADAISFNIEICGFHLVKHEFEESFYYGRKIGSIESGAGIHFNW